MLFTRLRNSMKIMVIILSAAFIVSIFYVGMTSRNRGGGVEQTIAKVNGTAVDRVEFQRNYASAAQYQEQTQQTPVSGDMVVGMKSSILDQMINQVLLTQAAKEAKIKVDRKAIDKEYDKIKNQFPTKESFIQALQENGYTEDSLRDAIEESKRLEKFQADKLKSFKITDADLAKAYEQVKASHILISDKEKAGTVLEKVKSGADFAELAKQYSEDTSNKDSGGDLGYFNRGQMVKPFEKAAFSMKVGEVSELVKSEFGYHIIKVTGRKEAKGKEFNKAKKDLKTQLSQEKFQEWFDWYKAKAKVEIQDHEILGYKLSGEKKFKKAILEYSKALENDPNNAYIYVNMGRIYMEQKQNKLALAKFEKAAEVNENDSSIRMILANAYKENKMIDKAVAEYKKASDLAPMDFYLHYGLLTTFQELKRPEEVKAEEEKLKVIAKAMEEQQKAQEEQQRQLEEAQKAQEEAAKKQAEKSSEEKADVDAKSTNNK